MEKYSTRDFDRDFPTDDACLEWLFKNRWPDGVVCMKCRAVTPHYRITGRPCYSCEHCGSHVYPMAGTIFAGTRFANLRLWFKAVAYMAVTRCGISSRQLSRDLGVGVKTGWRMFHQIRKALSDDGAILEGDVEVDETYIGGRRSGKRGRGAEGKTIVMGMVERGGKAKAKVVPDVKARTLVPEIQSSVPIGTAVLTDDLPSYAQLPEALGAGLSAQYGAAFPRRLRLGEGHTHQQRGGVWRGSGASSNGQSTVRTTTLRPTTYRSTLTNTPFAIATETTVAICSGQ